MTVRVLIVDDSSFVRDVLREGLSRFPDIEVIGEAADGKRAGEAVIELRPDVVTMDVVMPMVSRLEALRNIMRRQPTPIIVVSEAYSSREQLSLEAMAAGAIDVFPKPADGFDEKAAADLARLLRAAKQTRPRRSRRGRPSTAPLMTLGASASGGRIIGPTHFVGIVCSTGGPQTLSRMFRHLNRRNAPPIAIVQHISRGFDRSLATWLDKATDLRVRLARDGMTVPPGTVAIAPNERHLEIHAGGVVRLCDGEALKSHKPSGTVLLRSLAHSFGGRGIGVVLTGMGDDGADGAQELEAVGGTIYVEEPSTAIIDGMPSATIERTDQPIVAKATQLARMLRMHPDGL